MQSASEAGGVCPLLLLRYVLLLLFFMLVEVDDLFGDNHAIDL